jgi:predicted nucleotidyltransferase
MTTAPPLASLLFGAYRRQALGLLLLNPDREFHVRELSRVTSTSPGTMHKELSRLAEAGILRRRLLGSHALYSANRQCPIFDDLRNIFRKTSGLTDVIREALDPLGQSIAVAFVYGSVARGEEGPNSDIDLMVVGDAPFAAVVEATHEVQKQLGREINPVTYSKGEFRRKSMEQGSFARRLLAEKKLFVIGTEHDLGKLVEDKAASRARSQRGGNRKTVQSGAASARRRKV